MNFDEIRQGSLRKAAALGYESATTLPLLDESLRLRSQEEIEDRALTLSGVVAASYGFPRERVTAWLESEGLGSTLGEQESSFLQGCVREAQRFQVQVECLSAFAWALGFFAALDFDKPSPSHLVSIFPDFKASEPSNRFRSKAKLRDQIDVLRACDLAYCLHWDINQRLTNRKALPSGVPAHVVVERRRVLEWMLSSGGWEEVSLDT
jgi:hypothetical protein